MRPVRSLVYLAVLSCALTARAVTAQEHPLVKDHPGSWATTGPLRIGAPPEVSAAERSAATAEISRWLDAVRRMPSMAPVAGVEVNPHTHVSIDSLDRSDEKRDAFVTMQLTVNLAPYERIGQKVEANERDTVGSVTIRANDIGPLLGGQLELRDERGAFFRSPPEPIETRHGHPVYEEGNGDRWLIIQRHTVPIWAPVTRERYLQAAITAADTRLAVAKERRTKLPANLPASVMATMDEAIGQFERHAKSLKKALAAMSPAARKLPAVIAEDSGEDAPVFGQPADDPTAVIVCLNPALTDPKLPRSTPQILAVRILGNEEVWPGMAERLDKELDWTAFEAFMR